MPFLCSNINAKTIILEARGYDINSFDFAFFQRTGLLSMLDVECSVRGLPATYVQKVKVQHRDNRKLFEPKHCDLSRTFGIHHYAGSVVYDSSQFLETNRDVISDDIISVFGRDQCQFGFATHLFGNELKSLASPNGNGIGTTIF